MLLNSLILSNKLYDDIHLFSNLKTSLFLFLLQMTNSFLWQLETAWFGFFLSARKRIATIVFECSALHLDGRISQQVCKCFV